MAQKKSGSKDNFTMVRIRRSVLKLAKKQAESVDRSVANYIEHLVKQDARKKGDLDDLS